MTYLYIFCALMLVFFLVRNIVATNEYKRYQKEALFVFDDERRSFRIRRIIIFVCLVLMVVLFFLTMFLWNLRDFNSLMAELCLIAGLALFAFFPYSNGRFVVTADGIYVYNAMKFLPWKKIISMDLTGRGKDSYIILTTSRQENEHFSRNTFPLLITPADKTEKLRDLIRDMLSLEAKRQQLERLKNGV